MQNKKTIMAVSALFILLFHLWILVTDFQIEVYLRHMCVVGVDLFFFVSAYSIGKREKIVYKDFIINRIKKVYLKFILFSIIATLYFGWDGIRLIKIILGIELFEKGGGAFLWFLPAIMLVYLILPLYKKIDSVYPKLIPFLTVSLYLFLSIMISSFTTYTNLFILTNRIPVLLFGYYFAKYHVFEFLNNHKFRYWVTTVASLSFGIGLSYFTYVNHWNVSWYRDIFYILYLPFGIGMVLLLDQIKVNPLIEGIGSVTLELYGLQMIFGFKIASTIYQTIHSKLFSNIITIIVLVVIAMMIQYIFHLTNKFKWNQKESNY